jgi:hypothetical protein
VKAAESAKQAGINERSAAEPRRPNGAALDRNQRIDHFVARLKQKPGQGGESDARFSWPYAAIWHLPKEPDCGILLELPRLNAQVWLRGMEHIRSSAESLFFEDREQIPEMSKLSPVMHSP